MTPSTGAVAPSAALPQEAWPGLVGLAADLLGPVDGALGVDQHGHGVLWKVGRQRLQVVDQQRQQRLDPLDVQALGDLGEQVTGHRDLGGQLPGPAPLGLAQAHLPARPGLDRGQLGQRPLATAKARMLSTSSPQSSTRTGWSCAGGRSRPGRRGRPPRPGARPCRCRR